MNLIQFILIAVLDLVGVFFNFLMLWKCFKTKTKDSFLKKCRILTIWQSACQVMIVVADVLESWKLGFNIQPGEDCNVFRTLSISMMLFQACNITVILMLHSDHRKRYFRNREVSSKLKISIVLSLCVWWNCFSRELDLSEMAVKVSCLAAVVYFVLLFAAASRNDILDQEEDNAKTNTTEASKNACHLLWDVFKGDKKELSFNALLLTCLLMSLGDVPRSSFHFKKILSLLMASFTAGIALPLTISALIVSHYVIEEKNEKEGVIIL